MNHSFKQRQSPLLRLDEACDEIDAGGLMSDRQWQWGTDETRMSCCGTVRVAQMLESWQAPADQLAADGPPVAPATADRHKKFVPADRALRV